MSHCDSVRMGAIFEVMVIMTVMAFTVTVMLITIMINITVQHVYSMAEDIWKYSFYIHIYLYCDLC